MNTMTTTHTLKKRKTLPPSNGKRLVVHQQATSDFAGMLLDGMLAFRNGDFMAYLPSNWTGVYGKIADVFNETIYIAQRLNAETARVTRAVGKEGKLKQRMFVAGAAGNWAAKVESI